MSEKLLGRNSWRMLPLILVSLKDRQAARGKKKRKDYGHWPRMAMLMRIKVDSQLKHI